MNLIHCGLFFLWVSVPRTASQCSNQKNMTLEIEPNVHVFSLKSHLFEKESSDVCLQFHFIARDSNAQIVYRFTKVDIDCRDTLLAYPDETTKHTAKNICGVGINTTLELTYSSKLHVVFNSSRRPNDIILSSKSHGFILYVIASSGNGLASENNIVASFCGNDLFLPGRKYESKGQTITVELLTDDQGPRRGFVATVKAKYDPIPITTAPESTTPQTTLSTTRLPTTTTEQRVLAGPCADKCDGEESCYVGYNCTHFDHCYSSGNIACFCARRVCACGTLWNVNISNCDRAARVQCPSDPCLSMPYSSTYPSHSNCRIYYICNAHQQSLPRCCDKGYAYDNSVQKCMPDMDCKKECTDM